MFERKPRRFSNNRRRQNGRGHSSHGNGHMQTRLRSNSFSNGQGRNNFRPSQSAEKLHEKYTALAKEATSSGDISLCENYLQHADHFERVVSYKNSNQNGNNLQSGSISKEQNNNSSTDSTPNQSNIVKKEE